ncbi:ferredoxin [Curtobacterium sp. VKM Ac-2887]|uniref:ferredoxin n=1 Tax=Curtobacterium sp. VKM Ac-2887 TaxID=2783819 RepID=UPI00188A71D4|nr:ferredoxin [Curtobacterium sp. VKM Ac-2887]MBF4585710.1 ferredoxin [Curtobacterium sp. VKM Ac-2887]
MKVLLDQDKCIASGQCVMAAMGVFDQRDEDGIAVLLKEDVEGDELLEAQEAAAVCPALAIRVE